MLNDVYDTGEQGPVEVVLFESSCGRAIGMAAGPPLGGSWHPPLERRKWRKELRRA